MLKRNCWAVYRRLRHLDLLSRHRRSGSLALPRNGMFHSGWEFILDVFRDFLSRIDVVTRLVPGTKCE